jgi:hypothetical protein
MSFGSHVMIKTATKKKRGRAVFKYIGLTGLKKDLAVFEKKYRMTTQTFLEKVERGEVEESNDVIDWLGLAETFQELTKDKVK